MSAVAQPSADKVAADHAASPLLPDLLATCRDALTAADCLREAAKVAVASHVATDAGKVDPARLEAAQFAAHGYAWLATYVEALRQTLHWAERLSDAGRLGALERLILQAGFGEYLAQLSGGIALSQGEVVRPQDMAIPPEAQTAFDIKPAVQKLRAEGNSNAVRMAIADHLAAGQFGDSGLDDETLAMIRDQFRRFTEEKVIPAAHGWHADDQLIPMAIVEELADRKSVV